MITLDTSGIFALANRRDPDHQRARAVIDSDRGPYLVPAGTLGETAYLIEARLGQPALDRYIADLESGALSLDCGMDDLARIRELVVRYGDLPLGFADASVVACAERSGGRVLTFDQRDFGVVAAEGAIQVLPGA